jgi:transcription termination factor Rho
MSESQLERSVLEAKEREELIAIADALGTKPTSRAKKSDLITQILRATGVEDAPPDTAEKPRRTRARKPAAADEDGAEQLSIESDSSVGGNGAEAPQSAAVSGESTADVASADSEGGKGAVASADIVAESDLDVGRNGSPASPQQQGTELRGGGQGPSAGPDRQRLDGEPGNRRNRRRRGRDRTGERGERDLQMQAADAPYSGEPIPVSGYLDIRDEGYGFLRTSGFLPSADDVYVSISQVRRFALRKGDFLEGAARPAGSNEKYPALLRIDSVSGLSPDDARARPRFESLTPLFPDQKLRLELPGDSANLTARIVDLIAPIGKGQRGMIVSPPKAGKTTILKQVAHSIEANNPDVHLMVLLVDERPEEVTDMRRSVKGEVIASTFDRPAEEHTQVAELAIERAKRMVEQGKDVVIVLDGITRLARAYNLAQPATGRIMSGGIDTGALYPPKKFFGSARNIEEGGSLTILATALVETGSRMDEVIFEEFKGTGNMELRLDRRLAERRVYPAIDVNGSSTRHEELLFDRNQLQQVWKLRRVLNALASEGSSAAGLELLMEKIKSTRSNDEFLAEVAKNPAPAI